MLSQRTKDIMVVSLADRRAALELASAVDSGGNPQASAIAALGATADLSALAPAAASISASAGTYSNAAEPTGAEVDTAIDQLAAKVEMALDAKADNADADALKDEVEDRLDAIEAKIDAVIAALKAAALMAS